MKTVYLLHPEKHMQGFAMHHYYDAPGDPVAFSETEQTQRLEQAAETVMPQELVLDPTKPITVPKAGILAVRFCAE